MNGGLAESASDSAPRSEPGWGASDLLAAFLGGRDYPCPCCGYNLRDLTSDCCPECGDVLVLRVGSAHPRLAWFVTGLVGISVGFGFNLVLFAWAIVSHFSAGYPGFDQPEMIWIVVATPMLCALVVAWVLGRRWVTPRPAAARWSLALLAWALGLGGSFAFFGIAM